MAYRQGDDDSKLAPPPTQAIPWEIEVRVIVKVEARTFHEARQKAMLKVQQNIEGVCTNAKSV